MVLETALALAAAMLELNPFILLAIIFVLAFLAYKIFAFVMRIIITGVAFGFFPLIANVIGIPVPLTLQSFLWSGIIGITIFFVYMGISFGYKVMNLVFSPFKKSFKHKKYKKPKHESPHE